MGDTAFHQKIIQKWQKSLWHAKKSWNGGRRKYAKECEDGDESVLVGEVSGSKPAISNILNTAPIQRNKEWCTQSVYYCCSQDYKSTSNPVAACKFSS